MFWMAMGNMKKQCWFVELFLCFFVLIPCPLNAIVRPVHLRMLAGPEDGEWFLISDPISRVLSEEVLPLSYRTGGAVSNLDKINKKQAEVAFSFLSFLSNSDSAVPEYGALEIKNVSLVAKVCPQIFYLLVRTDFAQKHKLKSMEDLLRLEQPVRFASLKKGTGSEFFLHLLLTYGYNTDYTQLEEKGWQIYFNNYPETADNFVAGELDCFAYAAVVDPALLFDIESYTNFTVLPIGDHVREKFEKKFHLNTYVIDPCMYKGIRHPVKTLNDFTCMIVRRDLPDDIVYGILASLWRHRKEFGRVWIDFENFVPQQAVPEGVPLHPGAAMFWKQFQK